MSSNKLFTLLFLILAKVEFINSEHFTNTWAVEIKGGPDTVQQVAKEHGYDIFRKVRFN